MSKSQLVKNSSALVALLFVTMWATKAIADEVKGGTSNIVDRLGKDFYHRWCSTRAHSSNTKMPRYADENGKSPLPDYNNDAAKQFEAITNIKTLYHRSIFCTIN